MNSSYIGMAVGILFMVLGISIFVLSIGLAPDPIKDARLEEQKQKTEYMQLCADEGISAFNCLNNWMEVQP